LSLWLNDEPLGYSPAIGPRISFQLSFKQREDASGYDTNIFSIGPGWNFSWLSYVNLSDGTNKEVFYPGGGSRIFDNLDYTDYITYTRLSGTTNSGFTVTNSDGSKTVYGFVITNANGSFRQAFMTEEWNAIGQRTLYQYQSYSPTNPVVRLKFVVDGDGRTNSVYYTTNSYSTNLISYVVDPFFRTNFLFYNSAGQLTNIIDVAALPTSFAYDVNGWVNSMTTPYGPTTFQFTSESSSESAPDGRSVLVTEPDGGKHLYLCKYSAPGVASSYSTNLVPNTYPFTNTFDTAYLNLRNTFYWGPRQYAALSSTNLASLTANDFRRAHMKHWLKTGLSGITSTLSLEREPSPDGVIDGQLTWYDYASKPANNVEGGQILPLFVGRVLPDGTTTFVRTLRHKLGAVTNEITTFSLGASVALRTNSFSYAANGIDLLRVTNAVGVRVSSNAYNAFHQVLTNFNALGEKTTYTYDTSNRVTSITYPNGLVITNIYSTSNLLQQIQVGLATNTFTWSNNLVRTQTDPRGMRVTNTWDALQRLTRQEFTDGTSVRYAFSRLDLVQVVDRMGFTNGFGYDALGRKIAFTNALGRITTYDYCSCGSLTSVRDAANNLTSFFYNNAGQLTNTVYADGYATTNWFDLAGRLTNVTDNAGTSITNWFNNQGMLVAVSNALGRVTSAAYDILDRSTNAVSANGVTNATTYDDLDRPLTISYSDGGSETFDYTPNIAGVTSYNNQLGSNVVNYTYDLLGRKTNEVYPGITTNRFTYNAAGDLRTLTDGKSQVTSWGYDIFGQILSKTNAANLRVFTNAYDASGRLTNHWTPAKGTIIYSYNPLGSITNVDYSASPDIQMQYDVLNRLTNAIVAGTFTNGFAYDAVGQLLAEDGPWANDTITHTYSNRLRTAMSLSSLNFSYGYDAAKRLTNVVSPAGTFSYAHDAATHYISRLTLPNGSYITNRYDNMARLLETTLKAKNGAVRNSHSYQYDPLGQRTNQTRTDGSFVSYAYDGRGQVTSALAKESGGVTNRLQEQMRYVYDAAGNLRFRTNNAFVQTFSSDVRNQLTNLTRSGTLTVGGNTTWAATNVTVNNLTAARYNDKTWAREGFPLVNATTNFTAIASSAPGWTDTNVLSVNLSNSINLVYDLNGNLRTNGAIIYDYDDDNQLLTNWVAGAWRTEFVYDAQHRMRITREYNYQSGWNKTNETRFVYLGMEVIQERDTNNTALVTYTRAGSTLLARTDHSSGNHAFYHCDGNLNVTALVNTNQLIVAQYLYDPYGSLLAMSGPLSEANVYRFSSKRFISSAGTYCFGYRFYEPNLQRWLNPDPIGEEGGLNLYGYGLNNPISLTDPLGLDPSLAALFFQNLAQNGLSDARRVNDHLMGLIGDAAAGAVKTAYKAVTDPGGLAYDIYEGAQNLGTKLGTLAGDPCARKRAWEDFKNHMLTPEGIGDALFFVESFLAGGLFAPEAGTARIGAAAEKVAVKSGPATWNEFQAATRGQFATRAEAGQAWAAYKEANGIVTGTTRSIAARSEYLRSLADNPNTPSWMKPWLQEGRVPPGHQVDHIKPLSIGGPDTPANMRLQGTDIHKIHHGKGRYRPWV
jgi:RHS repeat-associated protein